MKTMIFETSLACSVETLYDFHADPNNLPKITPPGTHVTVLEMQTPLGTGSRALLEIRKGFFSIRWEAVFEIMQRPLVIVDTARRSPFKLFRHEHRFIAVGPDRSILRDTVTFALPFEPLTLPIAWLIARDLSKMFAFRHAETKRLLEKSETR